MPKCTAAVAFAILLCVAAGRSGQDPLAKATAGATQPQGALPQNSDRKCEGVYGLPGSRLLRVGKDRFQILTNSARLGRQSISGVASESDKTLVLRYFNGTSEVETRATYGIVSGHLWIGVMRRTGTGAWYTEATNSDIFCGGVSTIPDASVVWDMEKGTWRSTFNTYPAVMIDGFIAVAAGEGQVSKDGRSIIAVIQNDGGAKRALDVSKWIRSLMEWEPRLATRAAFTLPEGWRLGPVGSDPEKVVSAADLVKRLAEAKDHRRPFAVYEQIGEVLLTPWSIDLGPAGLIPVKIEAESLLGEWIGSQKKRVWVEKAPQMSHLREAGERTAMGPGRPTAQQQEAMTARLPLTPDDDGIRLKVYGWNCGMNHSDYPGAIYWFIARDRKLVRFIYPASCGGGGARLTVDLFNKS